MNTQLSNIKRNISTAEHHIKTADREYAYYKNCDQPNHPFLKPEDKQKHYLKAQQCYAQARDFLDRAKSLIDSERITNPEILNRWSEVKSKIKDI